MQPQFSTSLCSSGMSIPHTIWFFMRVDDYVRKIYNLKDSFWLKNGERLSSIEVICELSFHGGLSMKIVHAILNAVLPRDRNKN